MNISESINHFLPEIEIFLPKNEVDYYGFSYYLSKNLNLKYNYSFSSWVHGWIFHELKHLEQFDIAQYSPLYKIVANTEQKKFLNDFNFHNVEVAGYPYIYIKNNPNINRFKNSLLIIPPHNTNELNHTWNEEKYIQSILHYKKSFELIYFCIHQVCFNQGRWIKNLQKYGINYIIGANINDKNSLLRTKYIFQHFEFVQAPAIGSAIIYAAFDGCKVSLSQDYLDYKIDGYVNHPLYNKKKDYIDFLIYTKSRKYTENKFKFLFSEPDKSQKFEKWATEELGTKYKKDLKLIPEILGWRYKDKVKLFSLKYINSIKRFYKE
mgnify:CR=1 FL=1